MRLWLEGKALAGLAAGREDGVLKFVEQALVYKLPWAMEAVRVRGLAHNDTLEGGFSMEDVELGVAVSAVEAGSLNISAAMLMRAGFSSRLAAIHAVTETGAEFGSMSDLRAWLRSDEVASCRSDPEWPTAATHTLWAQFIEGLTPEQGRARSVTEVDVDVKWNGQAPSSGVPLRLMHREGETLVCGADYRPLGEFNSRLNPVRRGLTLAKVGWFDDVEIRYIGPGDLMRR